VNRCHLSAASPLQFLRSTTRSSCWDAGTSEGWPPLIR